MLILYFLLTIHRLALVNQVGEPNKTLCKSLNLVILNLHEWFTNNRLILNIDKSSTLKRCKYY